MSPPTLRMFVTAALAVVAAAEAQNSQGNRGSSVQEGEGVTASVHWVFFVYCCLVLCCGFYCLNCACLPALSTFSAAIVIKSIEQMLIFDLEENTDGKDKTVVIIHGMASCGLEAKNLKKGTGWQLAWASIKKISSAVMGGKFSSAEAHADHNEWLESLTCRLATSRDPATGQNITHTVCAEGWDVRPVHGLKGIFSSNPGEFLEIPLYKDVMSTLQQLNCNALACNYDWRLWGDYIYADNWVHTTFRATIEEAYAMHNRKVDVVTHSLGSHVITYALSKMELANPGWSAKYVKVVVNMGPAICGTVAMYGSFSVGPAVGIDVFPDWLNHVIADSSSTWPCMAVEFPSNLGEPDNSPGDPWKDHNDKPMICFGGPGSSERIKDKTYGMSDADVMNFINDVANNEFVPGRKEGPTLYRNACMMNKLCNAPPVPTHYIVSSAKDTIRQLVWKKDRGGNSGDNNNTLDLGDMPEKSEFEPGDGTVATKPLRNVFEFWKSQGARVYWHDVPDSADVGHKGLINSKVSLQMMADIIMEGGGKRHL